MCFQDNTGGIEKTMQHNDDISKFTNMYVHMI